MPAPSISQHMLTTLRKAQSQSDTIPPEITLNSLLPDILDVLQVSSNLSLVDVFNGQRTPSYSCASKQSHQHWHMTLKAAEAVCVYTRCLGSLRCGPRSCVPGGVICEFKEANHALNVWTGTLLPEPIKSSEEMSKMNTQGQDYQQLVDTLEILSTCLLSELATQGQLAHKEKEAAEIHDWTFLMSSMQGSNECVIKSNLLACKKAHNYQKLQKRWNASAYRRIKKHREMTFSDALGQPQNKDDLLGWWPGFCSERTYAVGGRAPETRVMPIFPHAGMSSTEGSPQRSGKRQMPSNPSSGQDEETSLLTHTAQSRSFPNQNTSSLLWACISGAGQGPPTHLTWTSGACATGASSTVGNHLFTTTSITSLEPSAHSSQGMTLMATSDYAGLPEWDYGLTEHDTFLL